MAHHSAAELLPILIRPRTRKMTVAITAHCNLRCVGCRYGRDFMVGHQLSLEMMKTLLDDAKDAGIDTVRLYGGEPLLHPDLPAMVAHAKMRGLNAYVTTNGILLKQKIAQLYAAGLRDLTLGFYGIGSAYDEYVQRRDRFQELSAGVAAVRERYGMEVDMQLNFLLMRPTCSLAVVDEAWNFAVRYDMKFRTDLIHYSLPYFSEGPDRCLQFTPEDRGRIEQVVHRLLELKAAEPYRFCESVLGIRSIPDWLLKGPDMKVPCDAYRMVWVGADGSVQLCYVTFPLGNLHQHRLRELLFTAEHRQAARDAFALRCPNCHCERDTRIQKHAASRRLYG